MRMFPSVLFLTSFLICITVFAFIGGAQSAERYAALSDIEGIRLSNQAQWHHDNWKPESWGIENSNNTHSVMSRFYRSGLITDKLEIDDETVLEVSDLFLRLSNQDQHRVLSTIDRIYGITAEGGPQYLTVEHNRTDEIIGIYSTTGLQKY